MNGKVYTVQKTENSQLRITKEKILGNKGLPKIVLFLFYVFSLYMIFPVIDIPLLGLSLSAPIFFFIALPVIIKPPQPWFRRFEKWILLTVSIWLGIFISTWGNGLISGGVNISTSGVSIVIHYAYWLLVFVITAFLVTQRGVIATIVSVLGWGILLLVAVRWIEVLIYGNIGAWTGTRLMPENTYGILFSAFSPFLLMKIFTEIGWKRVIVILGNFSLWLAAAINGSRGSWVAIAVGLVITLGLLVITRPKEFLGITVVILVIVGNILLIWQAFPKIATPILERYSTLENLEEDKSFMFRQMMVQKGWKLFKQSPLIGVGADRFKSSSVELENAQVFALYRNSKFDNRSAHNSYLGFLAESGLIGTIPYAILILFLFISGFRIVLFCTKRKQYWALGIFVSFLQMSIHMWTINSLTNTSTWFIYGLVAGMIELYRRQQRVKA